MDSSLMNLDTETLLILAVIITGISAIIGYLFNFLITWITKRSEERRYFRELIINTAIASWERSCKTLDQMSTEYRTYVPLDHYLLHMLRFSNLFLKKNFFKKKPDLDKIKKNMEELIQMGQILKEVSKKPPPK